MKRSLVIILSLTVCASILSGCAGGQLSIRETGAGIGALSGAAIGGIIGAVTKRPGLGAGIGVGLGAAGGGIVGLSSKDSTNFRKNNSGKSC